jgi:hypothetical protein
MICKFVCRRTKSPERVSFRPSLADPESDRAPSPPYFVRKPRLFDEIPALIHTYPHRLKQHI